MDILKISFKYIPVLLVSLSFVTAPLALAGEDYVKNAKEIVSKSNWKNMQTVTVKMSDF